jgi:hypothetical protein
MSSHKFRSIRYKKGLTQTSRALDFMKINESVAKLNELDAFLESKQSDE